MNQQIITLRDTILYDGLDRDTINHTINANLSTDPELVELLSVVHTGLPITYQRKLLIGILNHTLKRRCDHHWIDDMIDCGPEESHAIRYCAKCEVTRKFTE